jgi:hypothetical protein
MREKKSYSGGMMKKGIENEEIILEWLRKNYEVIDIRDEKKARTLDVDCGIITLDKNILLAEIKSDNLISENGNLCFEQFRINHFVSGKEFYLGWGWRSPAQRLIARNPKSNEIFIFDFAELRNQVGNFVGMEGRNLLAPTTTIKERFSRCGAWNIYETDKQKTTFNLLVPLDRLTYKKFNQ